MKPVKAGLIGSGIISWTYLDNMVNRFESVEVVGCSDLIPERSAARAEEFGIRQMTNQEIYDDPEIEIVVNTTNWQSHTQVIREALNAGKHVYTEKSLAPSYEEACEIDRLAEEKGLRIGCAPDTFLGGGYQTCRKLIDDGYIGKPISVHAFLARNVWPDGARNDVKLENGGTLPFDMAAYYIHAMVHLFGPVQTVAGFADSYPFELRNPYNPRQGESAEVPGITSLYGALRFESGVCGTLVVTGESFMETPRVEVYGSEGTLICPDPNYYGGPVMLMRKGGSRFMEIPITHDHVTTNKFEGAPGTWGDSRRGMGVAEMAWAIRGERPHRCDVGLHLHALELIHGLDVCTREGTVYTMETRPARPAALKAGMIGKCHEAALADWQPDVIKWAGGRIC